MTTYSEEHTPPPRALGSAIPAGVRRAIDSWFRERGVDPQVVRRTWFQDLGYGGVDDVANDVRDRWDDAQSVLFYRDLEEDRVVEEISYGPNRRKAAALISYLHVPTPLYLGFVERAVRAYVNENCYVEAEYADYAEDPYIAPVRYLNDLFATRRIDYRFTNDGRAEWHGDEGTYHEVVRPALDALADARLGGCREEFEAALGHLRAGTPKDREDAIEEAGKAVESAMKVVLDVRGIPRTDKENAEKLWQMIRDAEIIETPTHDAIGSTARLRNEWGGHGQGGQVRQIPEGIPELAVRASAAAVAYLAGLLP